MSQGLGLLIHSLSSNWTERFSMIAFRQLFRSASLTSATNRRFFSSTECQLRQSYKVVVVGGGSGGCSVAAKFSNIYPAGNVAVIEPRETHYYQPMWTLVGGGMKQLEQSAYPMADVLPSKAHWIKDQVAAFNPAQNQLVTASGEEIDYEYLIVGMGLHLDYHKIKGLPDAFETPGVCSNYSPLYVEKTMKCLREFKEGNAIFTFPSTPIKCAGAPQKAMYISEEYLRNSGKRDKATIMYNTPQGKIFGVDKYADALTEVCHKRDIQINFLHNLIEVKPDTKEAVFQLIGQPAGTTRTFKYEMLHVVPPMSAPEPLRSNKELANAGGFLELDQSTLQHVRFPNIFGIGDCTSLPTSKTAAAVAAQTGILYVNMRRYMEGKDLTEKYDGYTSCPLVTGYSKCILAEFDYEAKPLETLPINQAKERRLSFFLKKDIMPFLYWKFMLNGWWGGPGFLRKLFHLGFSK